MLDLPRCAFNESLTSLLARAPLNELGPGVPVGWARPAIERLSPEAIVSPARLADRDMGQACLAGLWLRFDFLEESHRISQTIETPSGSYWHGIMHRREPDFGNSKYWFRRVGAHPIEPLLFAASQEIARQGEPNPTARFLLEQSRWDAMRFIDLCEAALAAALPLQQLCRQIQLREWELLFDDCFRAASGQAR